MGQNLNKNEKSSKKSEKNLKDAPPPPLPFAHQIQGVEKEEQEKKLRSIGQKEENLTIQEASELMTSIRRKQEEIKRKLDEMFQQRGVTPEYLKLYMSNPNNFSSEEWKNLQSQRQSLIDSIHLPEELREKEVGALLGSPVSTDSKAKERRSKTAAARRRNWLPMR